MQYRELGKTGHQSSVIGLGCEHLDGKPFEQVKQTIDAALECGVNIFDVFMPGREVRQNIANALGSRRGDVLIQGHMGSVDINEQYDISRDMDAVKRYFEDLLAMFSGYIDLGMMFFIDSEADFKGVFETPFADYAATLKAQGKIGHIGFSSHNPVTAARVVETGLPETMMFSVNPAFDLMPAELNALEQMDGVMDAGVLHGVDPKRAALYKLCQSRGVGITVMKCLGAGKLLSPEHTPFQKPLSVTQCLHYALTRPAVASIMLGCKTAEEIRGAMAYLDATDEEKDYAEIIAAGRNDFKGSCVYCSHCQPCPSGIDIAAVNKYLDIARLDETNVPPSIRQHYRALESRGGDCIGCGSCEERCPFAVSIIENMAAAEKLLG